MEIGIWGDSITYGACDSETLGWVGRLRKSFEAYNSEDIYKDVYNFGICGDTTEELLRRFSVEADSIKPAVVIFSIGINDSRFLAGQTINKVPLDAFKRNMETLLQQARKHTNNIYIVGLTKVDDSLARPSGTRFLNETIQSYNACLREIAETQKLPFIDVFDVLDVSADLADGLHPNAQGYEKMFKTISVELALQ